MSRCKTNTPASTSIITPYLTYSQKKELEKEEIIRQYEQDKLWEKERKDRKKAEKKARKQAAKEKREKILAQKAAINVTTIKTL